MSPPSVAKAFSESIVPTLTLAGFNKDGVKRFRRISGDLCQCVFLHIRSSTRREFMIEYCTFLTVVPHTFYPLDNGGRFPVGSTGTWFRADTNERLVRSINSVTEHLPQLLEWFHATSSIEGYLSSYLRLQVTQPLALISNGHFNFNLGCAYLLEGDVTKALTYITKAEKEFDVMISEIPETQVWATPCKDRCRDLILHISAGTHQTLLNAWRQVTFAALKISK